MTLYAITQTDKPKPIKKNLMNKWIREAREWFYMHKPNGKLKCRYYFSTGTWVGSFVWGREAERRISFGNKSKEEAQALTLDWYKNKVEGKTLKEFEDHAV